MSRKQNYVTGPSPDEVQAAFWQGAVTRLEVQKAFDDYTKATVRLQEQTMKLDFALGYLLEKLEVTPEQVKEFMDRKMLEYAELHKDDPTPPVPEEKSRLIT